MDSSLHKITILLFVLLAIATPLALGQGTRVGFYLRTCSRAESIVQSTVKKHVQSDSTVAPGLLRMIFHDCFVHGCDASILIDGDSTEKTAGPNLLLRGYQVIDDAKTQLEAACPGVVSCADILALAARDAAVLAGALTYLVPTGRRDGRVSLASDTSNLPSFTDSVDVQKQKFADKGLSTQDLVTLVGGHTIGTVACQFIRYRLYNYTTSGGADPTIDPTFLPTLQSLCPQNGDGNKRIGKMRIKPKKHSLKRWAASKQKLDENQFCPQSLDKNKFYRMKFFQFQVRIVNFISKIQFRIHHNVIHIKHLNYKFLQVSRRASKQAKSTLNLIRITEIEVK